MKNLRATRSGTAAEWVQTTHIPLAGELCIERDTRRFKFGNGVDVWNALLYAGGGPGGVLFTHNQLSASAVWTINHNLGTYPVLVIVDSAGTVVIGDVSYASSNQMVVTFSAPFAGNAYLSAVV